MSLFKESGVYQLLNLLWIVKIWNGSFTGSDKMSARGEHSSIRWSNSELQQTDIKAIRGYGKQLLQNVIDIAVYVVYICDGH
jgi:hypothetical protein